MSIKNLTLTTTTNSLARGYRVLKFLKFSGEEDGKATLEHVGQFIL
jgi:hypothetical protein